MDASVFGRWILILMVGVAVLGGLHHVFGADDASSVLDDPQTLDAKRLTWLRGQQEMNAGLGLDPELFQMVQEMQSGPAAKRPRLNAEELRSPGLQAVYDATARPGDFVTPPSVSVPH